VTAESALPGCWECLEKPPAHGVGLVFFATQKTASLNVSTLPDTGLVLIGVALPKLTPQESEGNHAAEPCPGHA